MGIDEEGIIPFVLRKALGKSWATTLGGLLVGAPMVAPEIEKLFDGDPSTNPNWYLVASGLGAVVLGRVARTAWVTSEQEKGLPPAPTTKTPEKPS